MKSIDLIATRGSWRSKIVEIHFTVPEVNAETLTAIENEVVEEIRSKIPEVVNVIPVVRIERSLIVAIPVNDKLEFTGEITSPYFLLVDLKTLERKLVKNPHSKADRMRGYLISELLSEYNVGTVVLKKVGEGAKSHFRSRGINVRVVNADNVDEVVKILKDSLT